MRQAGLVVIFARLDNPQVTKQRLVDLGDGVTLNLWVGSDHNIPPGIFDGERNVELIQPVDVTLTYGLLGRVVLSEIKSIGISWAWVVMEIGELRAVIRGKLVEDESQG